MSSIFINYKNLFYYILIIGFLVLVIFVRRRTLNKENINSNNNNNRENLEDIESKDLVGTGEKSIKRFYILIGCAVLISVLRILMNPVAEKYYYIFIFSFSFLSAWFAVFIARWAFSDKKDIKKTRKRFYIFVGYTMLISAFLVLWVFFDVNFFGKRYSELRADINKREAENYKRISENLDQHGCAQNTVFGTAWCEDKQKCIDSEIEDCQSEEHIKKALAIKEAISLSDITVNITQERQGYAMGEFSLKSGGREGSFLAFTPRATDQPFDWRIIYSGNGTIDCNQIKVDHKFLPDEMLKTFCN